MQSEAIVFRTIPEPDQLLLVPARAFVAPLSATFGGCFKSRLLTREGGAELCCILRVCVKACCIVILVQFLCSRDWSCNLESLILDNF